MKTTIKDVFSVYGDAAGNIRAKAKADPRYIAGKARAKSGIRTAKSKLFSKATIYYVPSATGVHPNDEHIVVATNGTFFCDCKDFMTRSLPLLGTSAFTNCKHGKAVSRMLDSQPTKPPQAPPVKYGVFVDDHDLNDAHGRRSVDIPQEFGNLKAARFAIQEYEKHNGNLGRVARPL